MSEPSNSKSTVRIYERPSRWRMLLPRVLIAIVMMVISSVVSWWVYIKLF